MTTRTGIMDLTGSGKDLAELYETRVSGPTGTTHYLSQIHGKDLGSIFYLNASLGGLGLTGTVGADCGHKLLNGTDLGSLFCLKGTVAAPFSGLINGNFLAPTANQTPAIVATGGSTNGTTNNGILIGTNTAFAWTHNSAATGSIYANVTNNTIDGTYWFAAAVPTGYSNYLRMGTNAINTEVYISQQVNFPTGNYTLTFYAVGRNQYYTPANTTITVNTGSTTTVVTSPVKSTSWSSYSVPFTITTSGTQTVKISNKCSVDTGSDVFFTGFILVKV